MNPQNAPQTMPGLLRPMDVGASASGGRRPRGIVALVRVVVICTVLVGCEAPPRPDQFQSQIAIPVETTTIEPRTLEAEIQLHGVLESAEEVIVNVEFAAPVVRVLAEEGHAVAKGQPLLELDTSKLALRLQQTQHLLDQARVELENTRVDLSRLQLLAESDTVAVQRYDDARFAHESAVARVGELNSRLQLIRRDLDKRVILSPLDAVVGIRHVEAGQSIMAHQPLMTLHAVQSLRVSVFVGERHLAFLRVGSPGRVTTVGGSTESAIHSISAVADPRTGNYEVKLLLANADARLKPGMTAEVELRANRVPGQLLIPDSALVAWKGRHVVYVARQGKAERRVVDVAVGFSDRLIVDHGLSPGDRLIVGGARHVTQGSQLAIPNEQDH